MSLFSSDVLEVSSALKMGFHINETHEKHLNEYTPLSYAIDKNNAAVFQYLIHRGADINKHADGKTPLWCAAIGKRHQFVKVLLESGAEKTLRHKRTLLTYSIDNGDLKLFNCLIECGEDVNEMDGCGEIPLIMAVRRKDIEMTKTLLNHGAEFTVQSALLEAIFSEQLEIVNLLVERGADVNYHSVTGFTPLTKATKVGNLQITEFLIEKGTDVNVSDFEGNIPLINSIRLGHLDLIQLLVENGANVQQADGHGNVPIIEAINTRSPSIITLLIEHGADVRKADGQGNLAISVALNTKSFPIIKLLIEHGAVWNNICDKDGYSPLTQSVQKRNFDMLKFLLDRKVNVNESDRNQKTAFSLAVETDNVRFAKILTEHGALVDSKIEEIKQLAAKNDDWKRFFEELQMEKRILENNCTKDLGSGFGSGELTL